MDFSSISTFSRIRNSEEIPEDINIFEESEDINIFEEFEEWFPKIFPKEIPNKAKFENESQKISSSFEENNKKNEEFESLLGKKRLFIIEKPNDFAIFRPGQSNINSNQPKCEIDNSQKDEENKDNSINDKRKKNKV